MTAQSAQMSMNLQTAAHPAMMTASTVTPPAHRTRGRIFQFVVDWQTVHTHKNTRVTRVCVAVCRYENDDPLNVWWNSNSYPSRRGTVTPASLERIKRVTLMADRNRKYASKPEPHKLSALVWAH